MFLLFGPGRRVSALHVVVVVVVMQFSKGPKISQAAQRNETLHVHSLLTLPTDLPLRFFTYFLINE